VKKKGIRSRGEVMDSFRRFVPDHFVSYITDLFLNANVRFSIVKSRNTKLGDFRAGIKGEKHRITVNGDLNPYSFLVTTLHEFAHLHTFNLYGHRVQPHGKEWKEEFKRLLIPVIDSGELPREIENALVRSLTSIKASSCSDYHLSKALAEHDSLEDGIQLLEKLPPQSVFSLNGRQFIKGPLRRKRYVCREVASNRSFLISSLAKVNLIDHDKKL
jgi:SprT protein